MNFLSLNDNSSGQDFSPLFLISPLPLFLLKNILPNNLTLDALLIADELLMFLAQRIPQNLISMISNRVTEVMHKWEKDDGVLSNGSKKIKVTDG